MSDFPEPLPLEEIKAKARKYILGTYRPADVAFYFGQGEYLYDTDNKQYIDFLCGIAVTNLGHGEADIIEAIRDQADRLIHTSNLFYNQEQALLAEALVEHTFPGQVFFCNSGTEANEAAFKLARRHGQEKGDAIRILTLDGSFHGRTTAAMSMTGQERIRNGFGPLVDGITYLTPNDTDQLEKEIGDDGGGICALFLELVQGEGGVRPLDKDYVQAARELTDEHNVLLILDEIQTGMGRTAKLFAYEHYEIIPDAMTMAKGLANGFPIGAMLVREPFVNLLGPGMHGSTFGGNHLASRIAYETLRVLVGRDLFSAADALSDFFFARLRALENTTKIVKKVRGLGLHIGCVLDRPAAPIVDECRNRGLLVNATAEKVVRIMPPLTLSLERAAEGLDILEAVLREFESKTGKVTG